MLLQFTTFRIIVSATTVWSHFVFKVNIEESFRDTDVSIIKQKLLILV